MNTTGIVRILFTLYIFIFSNESYKLIPVTAFQLPSKIYQSTTSTGINRWNHYHYYDQFYHQRSQLNDSSKSGTSSSSTSTTSSNELERFLQLEHSMFYQLLLLKNEHVWTMIRDNINIGGCTIFAPTNNAIELLGEKKIQQLQDIRNDEVRNQIGSYHIIVNDIVTTEQLYDSGGIRTIATGNNPIVPIERSSSNKNIFDMISGKTKDDGTVTIGSNNARIVHTIYLQNCNCIIHQMDALISPNILWRYCDQLRIPGSK